MKVDNAEQLVTLARHGNLRGRDSRPSRRTRTVLVAFQDPYLTVQWMDSPHSLYKKRPENVDLGEWVYDIDWVYEPSPDSSWFLEDTYDNPQTTT